MEPRLLAYANQSTPRYTSYPTAPHFDESVTPRVWAEWLAALPLDASLSLYVHVPYCREICSYCACHTFALKRDSVLSRYVETLIAEIGLAGGVSSAKRVKALHWGGGTPNVLSPERFGSIMEALRGGFDLDAIREHSIEIDPRQLKAAQVAAYTAAGVNRVSLGVQDLNPHVQANIGRIQPFEQVRAAVEMLRQGGINAINFDVMYGLPGQSVADLENTILQSLSLRPNRLAVFGYAHVPWFKTRQRLIDPEMLPQAEVRWAQIETARRLMIEAGYTAIGFDHFAAPHDTLARAALAGDLRRNFQGYVDDDSEALIGFGPSAISMLPQGYAQNASEVGAWTRAIESREPATRRGRILTGDDRVRRQIIQDLLCRFEADLNPFGGPGYFQQEQAPLAKLEEDGLVEIADGRIIVPDHARQFARVVARTFDAYDSGARHSRSL